MDFSLIETFRFDPAAGFLRLERHLARLERSARHFSFSFHRKAIDRELEKLADAKSALRVRLELASNGALAVTTAPFVLQDKDTVWNIALARTLVNSGNELLAHKTTRRAVYEQARSEYPAEKIHEVIVSNERGEICEGTITNVFVRRQGERHLVTPPLASGLLPGVLRAELLEKGEAREAILHIDDFTPGGQFFVGNSLRGLIRARPASF